MSNFKPGCRFSGFHFFVKYMIPLYQWLPEIELIQAIAFSASYFRNNPFFTVGNRIRVGIVTQLAMENDNLHIYSRCFTLSSTFRHRLCRRLFCLPYGNLSVSNRKWILNFRIYILQGSDHQKAGRVQDRLYEGCCRSLPAGRQPFLRRLRKQNQCKKDRFLFSDDLFTSIFFNLREIVMYSLFLVVVPFFSCRTFGHTEPSVFQFPGSSRSTLEAKFGMNWRKLSRLREYSRILTIWWPIDSEARLC